MRNCIRSCISTYVCTFYLLAVDRSRLEIFIVKNCCIWTSLFVMDAWGIDVYQRNY